MCSLSSGKGSLLFSPTGDNTAIVSDNLYYLNILRQLNDQLLSLNTQMKNLATEGVPIYDESVRENALSSVELNNYYQKLESEREKINAMIKEYENYNSEEENTGVISNNNYFMFFALLLFCLFLIFLFIYLFFIASSSSSSSSSSSTTSGISSLLPNIT
jgi:ATP-dependent Zn protease